MRKNKKILKVGLTGGIASGKSTVARIFSAMGVPIYYADDEAKRLMVENQELKDDLISLLGKESYKNGNLNRAYIAEKIYSDEDIRQNVNRLVHPRVKNDVTQWFSHLDYKYGIEEAAILIESGNYTLMDKIIVVRAPRKIVKKRLLQRDKMTPSDIDKRLDAQLSDQERVKYADYIIENDGSQQLTRQVWKIHLDIIGHPHA